MTGPKRGVHLVGSIPLDNEEQVFRLAGSSLSDHLHTIPDGETGDRKNWIHWQQGVMDAAQFLEPLVSASGYAAQGIRRYCWRRDYIGEAEFGPLGYAQAAIASYATFSRLRRDGTLPSDLRFQVSLPTPLAPVSFFIDQADYLAVEPVYDRAMKRELDAICAAIPARDLAVQWDTALEFALLEGVFPGPVHEVAPTTLRLSELAGWVPADVALGYHFCYGDAGHEHFIEPRDTRLMVEIANGLFAKASRRIDWLHLPVPIGRDDAGYFEPLEDLKLPDGCKLYLGVIHNRDGVEGARRRIAAAEGIVPDFGVATECGWGRRPPADVPGLMKLSATIAMS